MAAAAPLAPTYREACYWLEGVEIPTPPAPGSAPPSEADVAVIGGGYTGVAAAWELARRGRSVVILERHLMGWGASTRNGGMVLPDVKHLGVAELSRRLGDPGRAVYEAAVDAVRVLERTVEDHSIECGYVRSGHLHLAHCPSAVAELETMHRVFREDLGLEADLLTREQLRAEIGSGAHAGGLVVPFSGGLHPARYFAGLARLALDAGARAVERAPATSIERDGAGFRVETGRGPVRAGQVLVATDGYTDATVRRLHTRVLPVGSYIIATEPLDPALAKELSPRGRMCFDTRNFLSYWRLSPDGTRMLFGGRASFAPTTVARARDFLYLRMLSVHPQLEGIRVEYAWGGNVGLTLDRIPRLGRLDGGPTYALGYSGTGVAASTLFGVAAAAWMSGGEPPPYANLPFPRIPLSWARPAWLPAVGLWFKWRDRCR